MIPPRCADPSRLAVVLDPSWLCRMAFAIVCKPTDDPTVKAPEMRPILCGWLARLFGGQRPAYIAAALDSKGKTWRHLETRHLPPEQRYKAGRTVPPPEYWAEQDGYMAILRLHGIPCYRAEGWEADDVAAVLTRHLLAAGLDVALVTLDHDWRALARDRDADAGEVYCWSYGRKDAKTIGPAEMLADPNYGLSPRLVPDMIALCGDGDNIRGVKGIGPDKARAVLERWGSVAGVLDAEAADVGELEAQIKSAEKHRDRLKREAKKAPTDGAAPALAMYDETLTAWRAHAAAEKHRRMIVDQRDVVELGLLLATLDPFAPIAPAFDLDTCRAGRFDVPALSALYRRLGFAVLADDVASTEVAA